MRLDIRLKPVRGCCYMLQVEVLAVRAAAYENTVSELGFLDAIQSLFRELSGVG